MTVALIGSLGDDLSIVNAARVGVHERAEELGERKRALIGSLLRSRHGTPFEMVQFQFRVRTPVSVAREWFRHRIGSFNEEATRWTETRPDFYVPEPEHVRRQVGQPGASSFEPLEGEAVQEALACIAGAYAEAYARYRRLLELGVATELARTVLPLGVLTEFVWSVNLRALFNFLSQRAAPNALLEIRVAAEEVERLAEPVCPVAFAAWRANGRRAP